MSGEFAPSLFGRRLILSFERESWLWTLFLASYFFLLGLPRLFTITATALLLIGLAGIVAMHLYVSRMWRRATAGKEAVAGPRARGTVVAARPVPDPAVAFYLLLEKAFVRSAPLRNAWRDR
ncbi:MAG: hypothetical protein ACOY41_04775 [Pseudomonadota bacterium]